MKYALTLIVCLSYIVSNGQVYAGGAAGGGSTEFTQRMNNVELIGTNISDAVTSYSTQLTAVKGTILDPIANGLIAAAQQQVAGDIISWANGGFQGSPLVIANPEKFIRNEGLNQAKIALSAIPPESIYGGTIFESVVNDYKDSDLKTKLDAVSKSNIPSLIQNQMCSDDNLTALALKDVRNPDGTYSAQALAARKTQLYNYACVGNPNTDPVVASRLNDLSTQNPNLGGWDKWLATTGGDNPKNKEMQARQIVAQAVEVKKDTATKDLYGGANAISQKQCIKWAERYDAHDVPTCEEYVTLTPAKAVQDALSKAGLASFDRLSNIMGEGALTSLLTNLAVTKLTQGLNTAISSTINSSGSVNVGSTVIASRPIVQDLISDPTRKTEMLKPMIKQLTYYSTSLDSLNSIDNAYLSDTIGYESRITQGRACYDAAVSSKLVQPTDSRVANAYAFYNERQGRVNTTKNSLNQELSKIASAKALVNDTIAKINTSNSTQEISTIFNTYTSTVENNSYPNSQTEITRKGDYVRAKSDVSNDTTMTDYQNTCNSLNSYQGGFR